MKPKFKIGELVYHPSTSTVGLVFDYVYFTKIITYRVFLPLEQKCFDPNDVSWFERQLQKID